MKLSEQCTQDSMYRNGIKYTFSILVTHTSFDCIIQNRMMEGVLIHPTHPVCMVACMGEAQCYACCTNNAKMKQRVEK